MTILRIVTVLVSQFDEDLWQQRPLPSTEISFGRAYITALHLLAYSVTNSSFTNLFIIGIDSGAARAACSPNY